MDYSSNFITNKISLEKLRHNDKTGCPMPQGYSYRQEVKKLDYYKLKEDLYNLIESSQKMWPSDYGNYGPLFIRMAWHSAGTYRINDGYGGASRGNQRFAPLNSWPDNANLDKARRLLWPIKQKYGNKISWADLIILAGNCSLEIMGLKNLNFSCGREDIWESPKDVYWGKEKEMLQIDREDNYKLEKPLASTQMGLIYVNPEGPAGNPDPLKSAQEVRETFKRMAMNDEETVALIAGGHTFGKCHGASLPSNLGPSPENSTLEEQGLGWKNTYKKGNSEDTITSGIEGAWKKNPTTWNMGYLETLFKYDWQLIKGPGNAYQWEAVNVLESDLVEDAHIKDKKHKPIMTTADLSLKYDPTYKQIALNYLNNPSLFENSFKEAWFKLTHRDLGPSSRYIGPEVPKKDYIWQDTISKQNFMIVDAYDINYLKNCIINTQIPIKDLVRTAFASASTFRSSDRRGGANGARIQLQPQINWEVNEPEKLKVILEKLNEIKRHFNNQNNCKKISLADLIVLAGVVGIEEALKKAGYKINVPFTAGRNDATQSQTDIESFNYLEPIADGFRNYKKSNIDKNICELLIDKAKLLNLEVYEMVVLLGGLRVIGINYKDSNLGVLTKRKESLTNDYFVNLLNNDLIWQKDKENYKCHKIDENNIIWEASEIDLLMGAHPELRAICEVYASKDNELKFILDFINVWDKIMNLDRYDLI